MTMSVIDEMIAAMPSAARTTVQQVIDRGAAYMVAEPWRIVRALYPFAPRTWPPTSKTLVEMLADARDFVRTEEELLRTSAWEHDANRHLALMEATEALVRLIAATGPVVEDAARRVA